MIKKTRRAVAVDDSADELMFLKEAWQEAGLDSKLETLTCPRTAADSPEEFLNADLIILDQRMPQLDGSELTAHLRKERKLQTPIVMLSTSDDARDVRAAYKAGANAYLLKPNGYPELVDLVRKVQAFWLEANIPAPRA